MAVVSDVLTNRKMEGKLQSVLRLRSVVYKSLRNTPKRAQSEFSVRQLELTDVHNGWSQLTFGPFLGLFAFDFLQFEAIHVQHCGQLNER